MKSVVILWFLALTIWALNPAFPRDQGDQTVITINKDKAAHSYEYCDGNPVDGCWESLDCSLTQIDMMSMASRLEFIKYLSTWRLDTLHSVDQFHAFEGVVTFFMRKDIANSGTWLSLVNAACIEALQRGAAISLGLSSNTGGNPASEKWADYFHQRRSGRLTDRSV
ncbi:hypothetical protein ACJ72_05734 [Emergomyces africanus]|uniref:Uncharacterized protein n=1 Tax=Emergomyces africanus TaxID=1955775 RepID=A0A1B7NT19_9EURO|nr:hypothetical protein ACJ72_05734 [Emergomyces africanus]